MLPTWHRSQYKLIQVLLVFLLAVPAAEAAVVPCTGGSAGSFACDGIDLLSQLPLSSMGGGNGNDIWGWTDSSTGKEYALMGRTNGTAFVDISDPENPLYLGNLPTQTVSSSWRDIKTYADHAFIVADSAGSHGMQVFDLTRLRNVASPPATFSADTVYSQFGSAHNIAVDETSGFAFAVDSGTCSGGLHIIDVSTPTSPVFAGCHSGEGTIHDAQCVTYLGPDPDHQGAEICVTATLSGGDTMDIIDVTDKGATTLLSSNSYSGASISHQSWLSEDHRFVFHGDEGDETSNGHDTRTYIFDVTNLDAPVLLGNYTASLAAIDHNMYVSDGLLYQANYTSGLRVLDPSAAGSGNLSEVAFFDTRPETDGAVFEGAWSVYPFFDSCSVIVSDMQRGLFVLGLESCSSSCGNGVIDPGEQCDGTDLGGASCSDNGCTGGSPSCTASCTLDYSSCTGCPGCSVELDFDDGSAGGWFNSGSSTCSTGSFVVATPTEQTNRGVTTQVGGDHTSGAGNAYFSATNSSAGGNDVDGGTCIVESPTYAVADASDLSLWYFHGQRDAGDDAGDFFRLELSTDGGGSYTPLAEVGDVTSQAAWAEATASVPAGADVKLRLQVADGPATGDLVEAGVDDLAICAQGGGCTDDGQCDDGVFCNGVESCVAGSCQAGAPVDCDDGISCTNDACNEASDSCDQAPDDSICDNGLFCDGTETCDVLADCQTGSSPCGIFGCDEDGDVCFECNVASDCDDGLFCNGAESCVGGSCEVGSDPCPGQGCDEDGDVCTDQNGPQQAVYDAGLGAPWCAVAGSSCDSLSLLDGRGTVGPEPNQPNTLDGCTDGTSGSYHSDESNDALVVATLDGADFTEGATVQVDATVYAWSTGTSDHLDLYYAADANDPTWTPITTLDLSSGGLQTLSAQYTLPAGNLQAVRANFRYQGSASSCSGGSYDDADDLVFAVGAGTPECSVDADCDNGLFCDGVETCSAGSCLSGSDPCPGQSCDEVADVCVAGGCTVDEDFEAGAAGWNNDPAATCSTGDFVVGDPTNPSGGWQIVGSHSGTASLFTATNSSAGNADVDGGNCILASPSWSVAGASTLSVWYWHGQRDAGDDPSGDFFALEYSTDGGASWSSLASQGDATSNPVWTEATAAIPAGSTVQLRVQCSDGPNAGDLVECGVDDVSICD